MKKVARLRGDRPATSDHIAEMIESRSGIILDVGCGASKQPGAVGMDRQALPGVDIVWNWNEFPWPFPDESVLTVIASHVIEHVSPIDGHWISWMDECWRILKPGRQVAMVTPYGSSELYIRDPTHTNPCNEQTAWYFDPEHASGFYGFYEPAPWQVELNAFHQNGILEWVWRKREDLERYHADGHRHYGSPPVLASAKAG